MNTIRTIGGRVCAALAFAGMTLVFGCGDDSGLGKRFPVSGTVNSKGQPVENGTITFVPSAADGRSAAGQIEKGAYKLTTVQPNDGALPGAYKVTVVAKEIQDADAAKISAIAKGGQSHHDATFAKAMKNAKSLVPSKYSLTDTSGLTADVKDKSNTINFDLQD